MANGNRWYRLHEPLNVWRIVLIAWMNLFRVVLVPVLIVVSLAVAVYDIVTEWVHDRLHLN